jgi:hypothetical protein
MESGFDKETRMKRPLPFLAAGLALLLGAATALAQQPQRINYRVTNYFNVPQDKVAAMLDEARTSGRKLIQERIASGENITSWVLLRTAFRGVTPAINYNYAVSVDFDGAPQTPNVAARDQVYRKATGMSFQEYNPKVNALRTNVGSVLYRVEATAPGSTTKDGNYIAVTRWKITQGRGGDYGNFVTNRLLPLNTQAAKEGRSVSWSASRVVSPGGGNAPFNAVLSNTVKDLAAALPTTPNSPELAQTRFAQVFPKQNFSAFVELGQALRTLVRTEMFEVMVAVQRPSGVTSASK